jgi:hypothetical protein
MDDFSSFDMNLQVYWQDYAYPIIEILDSLLISSRDDCYPS